MRWHPSFHSEINEDLSEDCEATVDMTPFKKAIVNNISRGESLAVEKTKKILTKYVSQYSETE